MDILKRRPLCNNNPNSAPQLNGRTFYLCWRCFGSFIGIIIIFLINELFSIHFTISLFLFFSIPAIIDYFANRFEIKEPRNSLRFLTGLMLGVSIGGMIMHFVGIIK